MEIKTKEKCSSCQKTLGIAETGTTISGKFTIKCPRCGTLNDVGKQSTDTQAGAAFQTRAVHNKK